MIYPFECNNCKSKFELNIFIKDYENKNYECPNCKSKDLKRIYNSFSIKTNDGFKN
jgi:putative FmdB family regulatory protein